MPEIKNYEYQNYRASSSDFKPYAKWDLMKHYRETIHDTDHKEIVKDLKQFASEANNTREVVSSAKKFVKARRIPGEKSKE